VQRQGSHGIFVASWVLSIQLLYCDVQGLQAMGIARAANVKMAFGSDLLGAMHK
jgi:hypothetical protein